MPGIVGEVTAAPKEAVQFATSKWGAALFMVTVIVVVIVIAESHRPGIVIGHVANFLNKIPVLGPRFFPPYAMATSAAGVK